MQANFHAGKYRVCFTDVQGFGESKKKGTPYFHASFKPVAYIADDGTEVSEIPDATRDLTLYLTENSVEGAVRDLRKIGFDGKAFSALDPSTPNYFKLEGREIELECKHEVFEGRTQERWQVPLPPRHSELKADDRKGLDKLFGKHLKK